MNLMKKAVTAIFALSIFAFATMLVSAQEPAIPEPSYDVSLRLIVGSNEGSGRQLPPDLTGIARVLKEEFAFSNYRMAGTLTGRLSNGGTFEYRSVVDIFGKQPEGMQTFFDWNLSRLRKMPTPKGQPGVHADAFRFGARVPVAGFARDEAGKTGPTVNYESIGVNVRQLGLAENAPTLIGTLNLPGTDGTIFLVVTVRPVDM